MVCRKTKWYSVLSPEIYEIIPVLDFGVGPKEYFRCYVEVEAQSKRDAKIRALQTEEFAKWVEWQRYDLRNPFVGLVVSQLTPHSVGDTYD